MIDNFEFSDTKQIRKTLLISSFAGISFKMLVKNSTGNIEFLGFKIPVEDASIIPQLVGYLIIFEIIALLIRYSDEFSKEKYAKFLKFIKERNMTEINIQYSSDKFVPDKLKPNYTLNTVIKKSVFFLDVIFPILLGLFAILKIFFQI
ncbi:hypothetical protein QGN23_03795 [Chryseobacterium gotjawalense]|uniref:DUF3899 domain-containing protein n=1 Tax=Chryseobacterium gotjawalense TaxID=3042315 RepID=A0ABY8RFW3_9FLAO|nr:hypothetical protein [Chryseobacterium sp. wdc7]WHF52409.1 hypothetical protein QGN23_03795 [Chryseobacterium sp. wdc7]